MHLLPPRRDEDPLVTVLEGIRRELAFLTIAILVVAGATLALLVIVGRINV